MPIGWRSLGLHGLYSGQLPDQGKKNLPLVPSIVVFKNEYGCAVVRDLP
jgi:hypothetical protein